MKIDLRSDTVTRPTPAMLSAMMNAPVGDDVFGDDPTVKRLEERMAELFGKEAALFCPSGTMCNQIALKAHTQPGGEIVCHAEAHIFLYEGGGAAMHSGCSVKPLLGERGVFGGAQVLAAVNPADAHYAHTALVSIENTANRAGGTLWSLSEIADVAEACRSAALPLHLDGARIFNACVAGGYSPHEVATSVDSVSVCLSKGLGCPVGSVLLGHREFIAKAHRLRKVFGGGMRQVGYLAAAGLYALDHHIERLAVDHRHAEQLGDVLCKLPWVKQVHSVKTNIVVVDLAEPKRQQQLLHAMSEKGVLAVAFGAGKLRFVTHLDVDERQCDAACGVFESLN